MKNLSKSSLLILILSTLLLISCTSNENDSSQSGGQEVSIFIDGLNDDRNIIDDEEMKSRADAIIEKIEKLEYVDSILFTDRLTRHQQQLESAEGDESLIASLESRGHEILFSKVSVFFLIDTKDNEINTAIEEFKTYDHIYDVTLDESD